MPSCDKMFCLISTHSIFLGATSVFNECVVCLVWNHWMHFMLKLQWYAKALKKGCFDMIFWSSHLLSFIGPKHQSFHHCSQAGSSPLHSNNYMAWHASIILQLAWYFCNYYMASTLHSGMFIMHFIPMQKLCIQKSYVLWKNTVPDKKENIFEKNRVHFPI